MFGSTKPAACAQPPSHLFRVGGAQTKLNPPGQKQAVCQWKDVAQSWNRRGCVPESQGYLVDPLYKEEELVKEKGKDMPVSGTNMSPLRGSNAVHRQPRAIKLRGWGRPVGKRCSVNDEQA